MIRPLLTSLLLLIFGILNCEPVNAKTSFRDNAPIVVLVGNPASTLRDNLMPLNFFYKNSLSETIYFAAELSMPAREIIAISYKNNFSQSLPGKAVKIYMANTTASSLSGGWLPGAGFSLVFDGVLNFPLGINEIYIQLQTPFQYNGTNLAVRAYRQMENQTYSISNDFYQTATTSYPNRTRYAASDMTTYNPLAPQATGILSNRVPNTRIWFRNEPSPVNGIAIVRNQESVNLSWEALSGASSYSIYASGDPLTGAWSLAGETVNTSYQITVGMSSRRFFRVVAILQ
ncbi:MAG: hypothetical protein Q8J62_09740 [Candidatus Cloacimonadaceae bacterium]|nr:hypothetical protein [Candidatus Cloacimonadaceae bacterium]